MVPKAKTESAPIRFRNRAEWAGRDRFASRVMGMTQWSVLVGAGGLDVSRTLEAPDCPVWWCVPPMKMVDLKSAVARMAARLVAANKHPKESAAPPKL
jgi:hypothetical protein